MTIFFLCIFFMRISAFAEERVVATPFILMLPSSFKPPIETVSFSGSTYTYLTVEKKQETSLTVTLLDKDVVHEQTGALDSNQCAKIFLNEIRTEHDSFFVSVMVWPIDVGGITYPQFRWSGERNGVPLTGVLTCVLLEESYFVLSMTDNINAAAQNFPAIRKSIQNITFR